MLNSLKTALSEAVGLSKDALHVHLGLLIFLAAVLLLRTSLGSWTPWLVLLLFELANEAVDLLHEHDGIRVTDLSETAKDIVNTMFWPTVVVLFTKLGDARNT